MTDSPTRLLLLGAVTIFEPVNAYQLRRELLSWQVDEWAHINPGSIYSGLNTLTKQGHLIRHELAEGKRTVGVYQISDAGRAEFDVLFDASMLEHDQSSSRGLYTAFAFQSLVTRDRLIDLLVRRQAVLDAAIDTAADVVRSDSTAVPPNVSMLQKLWFQTARAERDWLIEMVGAIRAGGGTFRDDTETWSPPADDPGWVMAEDRDRYRRILGID